MYDAPPTYDRKAKVESISRFMSFHTEIWENNTGRSKADRQMMRHYGKLWIQASPDVSVWAHEKTDDLWERLQQTLRTIHGDLKFKDLSDDQKRALNELRYTFFYSTKFEKGSPSEDEILHFARKLNKGTLFEEMEVRCGLTIAESHMTRSYFSIESGWRSEIMEKHLKEVLGNVFSASDVDKIFMSRRLLKAAGSYYSEKFTGDPEKARKEFIEQLHEIAGYRPHDLALALLEREEKTTIDLLMTGLRVDRIHLGQRLSELSLRADEINRYLIRNLQLPVDYSRGFEGLSSEQQGRVRTMLVEGHGLSEPGVQTYFTDMKKLSELLRGSGPTLQNAGEIKKFLNIKYEPLLTKVRWMDIPLDLLQNPERLGLSEEETAKLSRISDIFTMGGWDEQSGPMRRMWRDLAGAEKAKNLFMTLFKTVDEKEMIKIANELFDTVAPYQGPDHASIAVIQGVGAWLGMAMVKKGFGPLLEALPNSSDFKKFWSDLAPSISADQARHTVGDVELKTAKLNAAPGAKGVFEAMEAVTGITNWRSLIPYESAAYKFLEKHHLEGKLNHFLEWANERQPSGVWKLRGIVGPAFFLLLLGIYALTVAGKEGKQEVAGHG